MIGTANSRAAEVNSSNPDKLPGCFFFSDEWPECEAIANYTVESHVRCGQSLNHVHLPYPNLVPRPSR